MVTPFRRLCRLIGLGAVIATALVDYALRGWWLSGDRRPRYQARWLMRYSRATLRVFGIRVRVEGRVQAVPMAVYNHLSYLDILIIASVSPSLFIAKADVSRWPLFGPLARCGGTIFVQREHRGHVRAVTEHLETMAGGVPVVLFPEGTSSDGSEILHFHSSLLAPAAEGNWLVQPGHLAYTATGGDVRQEVCWWGAMTLVPHVVRLAGLTEVQARIRLGEPIQGTDRKQLARQLHQAVSELARPARPKSRALEISRKTEREYVVSNLH